MPARLYDFMPEEQGISNEAGCPIISNSLPALFMPTPKLNDLVAG